ncbi:serine/threonine/tyrosine-interacting protein A-like isoform X2 [Anneissia japonica]|uniref:serine/threonine/tyrosine-interacting protein A-like isoform X2 n=1 Tax=Anneissia japonica TaxID=1529436 RepID=UPI001425B659|nr:serine/threonine/tyrosine-interacting protein A-like isoform X2 [Anneissia japonica]
MNYLYSNLSIPSPQYPAIPKTNVQEILPSIFLGPYAAATKNKRTQLSQFGISHIICIRHHAEANYIKPNFPDQFRYLVLEIADSHTENIIRFFPEVKEFIDNCLEGNGKCLVHGNAGISRSAALVIAYIMETYGLDYSDAFRYVGNRRFCIIPNEGFQQQLIEYEPICKARAQLAKRDIEKQDSHITGLKRRLDDDDDDDKGHMAHTSSASLNDMMIAPS